MRNAIQGNDLKPDFFKFASLVDKSLSPGIFSRFVFMFQLIAFHIWKATKKEGNFISLDVIPTFVLF